MVSQQGRRRRGPLGTWSVALLWGAACLIVSIFGAVYHGQPPPGARESTVAAMASDHDVSQACRLRKAILLNTGHDHPNGIFQGCEMSDADEDRLDAAAGPQDRAHGLAPVNQRGEPSGRRGRVAVLAAKPTLGTPDGRAVDQQTRVRGQTESPGVGQTLAVEDEHVGYGLELAHGGQSRRYFPEAEQSGNVREPHRPPGQRFLNDRAGLEIVDYDAGHATLLVGTEGQIHTGDQPDRPAEGRNADAAGESLLETNGRLGTEGPAMERWWDFHVSGTTHDGGAGGSAAGGASGASQGASLLRE